MKKADEKIKRFFDDQAEDYNDKYCNEGDLRSFIFAERKRVVLEMLGTGFGRILDIGCGPGVYADSLTKRCGKLYGVDVSDRMIAIAKDKGFINAEFSVGAIDGLKFGDNFFDAVVCAGVLEYLDDITKAVQETARVTKDKGVVIFTAPNACSVLNKLDLCARKMLKALRSVIKIDLSKSFMNYDFEPNYLNPNKIKQLLEKNGFRIEDERFHIFRISLLNRLCPKLSLLLAQRFNFISGRRTGINYIVKARLVR